MEKNRLPALSLAVLALLGLLAGCAGPAGGSAAGEDGPGPAGVELRVVTSYGSDDGHRKDYEDAVRGYEDATGNRVQDASGTSNEAWKAQILRDFQTGDEPDVLFFFTGADAEPIIQAGKVVDLAQIRSEYPGYASNMRDTMLAKASDGKSYAVPSSGFWEDLFVNTRVLADCGLAVPGPDYTWDQFLADCQTIRDKGYTPIACSVSEVPHYWFEFCVMNNGTLSDHLDVPASADDAAGRKWAAALYDMKELYERGFFPVDTLTASDAQTVQLFSDGEAAFLIDGSWKVSYFMENCSDRLEDFAVAYVPAKGARKATETIGGISMGYFITKKAWDDPAKRQAAVQFVEHMTSDAVLSTFVTTEVTALKDGASPAGLNALQQSAADANARITGMAGPVQDTVTSACKAALFGSVPDVLTGAITAEEALAAAIALN